MLFKRRQQPPANPVLSLRVQNILHEGPRALRIVFEPPAKNFSYTAGQFLTFILQLDGKEVRRCYSLCSCPELEDAPAVVIKSVENGLVSHHLHKTLRIGSRLATLAPMGRFTLSDAAKKAEKIVLIAGGSGITPLFSIAQSLLHSSHAQVSLLYGNHNEESIILRNSIEALLQSHRERFRVIHFLEHPRQDSPYKGLLQERMLRDMLTEVGVEPPDTAFYFVCGPTGMMDIAIQALKNQQVPAERIKKESFVAGITSPAETIMSAHDRPTSQVTIFHDDQTHTLSVPYGKTILACSIEEDLGLPFSCQNGICATCRGKLLKGQIHMAQDEALTDEERAQGYILCCQAQPLEKEIVIRIE